MASILTSLQITIIILKTVVQPITTVTTPMILSEGRRAMLGLQVKPPLEKFREKYHPKQFGAERAPMRIQGMINETVLKMRGLPSSQVL